jgi:hypothetical protein
MAAAVSLVAATPAANADSNGCTANGAACIYLHSRGGSGPFITHVHAYKRSWYPQYKGHYHITGPGISSNGRDAWGPPEHHYYPNRTFAAGSQFCVEAWTYSGGRWVLKGRACKSVEG